MVEPEVEADADSFGSARVFPIATANRIRSPLV